MSTAVAERAAKAAPKPKPDRRKAPVAEFEIPRNDWIEMLSDAAIFAGTDDTLPMLTCVRLQLGVGGQIVAAATDRFTLGRRTYQLEGVKFPHAIEVLVSVTEITAMAKIHGKTRRGIPNLINVTVTGRLPHDTENKWTSTAGSVRVSSGWSGHREVVSTHPGMDLQYVDVDALIDGTLKAEPTSSPVVGFRPEYVARFARVSKWRGESMRMRLIAPDRPMLVTIGDHFTGLVMSVRLSAVSA